MYLNSCVGKVLLHYSPLLTAKCKALLNTFVSKTTMTHYSCFILWHIICTLLYYIILFTNGLTVSLTMLMFSHANKALWNWITWDAMQLWAPRCVDIRRHETGHITPRSSCLVSSRLVASRWSRNGLRVIWKFSGSGSALVSGECVHSFTLIAPTVPEISC